MGERILRTLVHGPLGRLTTAIVGGELGLARAGANVAPQELDARQGDQIGHRGRSRAHSLESLAQAVEMGRVLVIGVGRRLELRHQG